MDLQVVSVSQVTDYLRLLTESDAFLSNVWVQGDVTNVFLSRAGHLYFTLSDGEASLKAVAFRPSAMRIQHAISAGARVTVGGRVTVYVKDATCQIYVEFADADGLGMQALALARLRARLESDGLFEPYRKKEIPSFPRVIGVVTSPSGAVIHDIQTVLRRRFPLARLLVSPAQVQGNGAVDSILAGLDLLLEDGQAAVIIIARGGGSAEDLSAFNDERLARAVFACAIPVVSAIGHETDFSILDDVADLRAPTPTAAAELITPDVADFALELIDGRDRMGRAIGTIFDRQRQELDQLAERLDRVHPIAIVGEHNRELGALIERLRMTIRRHFDLEQSSGKLDRVRLRSIGLRTLDRQAARLQVNETQLRDLITNRIALERLRTDASTGLLDRASLRRVGETISDFRVLRSRLSDLNPDSILDRGFSVLTNDDNQVISRIDQARIGGTIRAIVRDGTISATVDDVAPRYQ